MNRLAKITTPDRFTDDDIVDGYWHLLGLHYGDPQVFCNGVYLADGMGYEEKSTERGGITCPDCLRLIKAYKEIKL